MLDLFLEKYLKNKINFILEGNFNFLKHSEKIKAIFNKHGYDSIEILLVSDPKVLIEKFKERWHSGERHRGHADNERFNESEKMFKENQDIFLKLNNHVIKVDTSDFVINSYSKIIDELKMFIKDL